MQKVLLLTSYLFTIKGMRYKGNLYLNKFRIIRNSIPKVESLNKIFDLLFGYTSYFSFLKTEHDNNFYVKCTNSSRFSLKR